MATVYDPNQDQAQGQGTGQPNQASAASQTNNGSGPISTGSQGAAASSTPSSAKPGSSGQFTNIQNYINANQGNNLGQQTEGQFNNLKQQGETQLNDQTSNFDKDASATGQAIQSQQAAVQAAPTQLTGSDEQYQQGLGALQSGLGYQYNGPTGLANTAGLQTQAQNLGELGNLTNSNSGRFTLLQKFFNTPTYTQGQTNLDNLLLGSQPQALQQIRQTANSLGNDVNNATTSAQSQVSQLQNQAQGLNTDAQQAINSGAQGLNGQISNDVTNYVNQQNQNLANPTSASQLSLTANPNLTFAVGNLNGPTGSQTLPTSFGANLTPQQAAQLGILNYSGPNAQTLAQIQANPNQFAGQVDPSMVARYNAITGLDPNAIAGSTLPASYTTGGTQLQNGTWGVNAPTQTNQQTAYQAAIQNELGQAIDPNSPILQQYAASHNMKASDVSPGATYQQILGNSGQDKNSALQQQIQQAVSQAALQNLLSKYQGK